MAVMMLPDQLPGVTSTHGSNMLLLARTEGNGGRLAESGSKLT